MVTEKPLVSMKFRNIATGQMLIASVFEPRSSDQYSEQADMTSGTWWARYSCEYADQSTSDQVGGASWIQALLLALHGACMPIIKNENGWENLDGCPAWVLIPKLVPISWGYELYRKVLDFSAELESALQRELSEKRNQLKDPGNE